MADRKGETCEASSFPESVDIKHYAPRNCIKEGDAGDMTPQISASRVSGELAMGLLSAESKQGSAMVFEGSSKCHEADMQYSSDDIASTQPTPAKSDVSTEIGLPLSNGSSEVDVRKMHHLNAPEDGLNAPERDPQQRTESSCSNSLSVILPVSFSNCSYQDIKEACSFRNCGGSADSSNSKVFDRSEEPVTASSESGVSDQLVRTALRNARSRNSVKISSKLERRSSLLTKNGDNETSCEWDHGATTPEDSVGKVSKQVDICRQQPAGIIGKISVCSGNSGNLKHTSESVENIRLCHEHDDLHASHSGERMVTSDISGEDKDILAMKVKPLEKDPEVNDKIKGDFWANESSESTVTKHSKVSMEDQDTFVAGFDLNEDINVNGMDDCVQPLVATTSSQCVIQVVARAGRPIGRPKIPLKFEGGLGWKGAAETSAFRPAGLCRSFERKTCSRNHGPKDSQGFTGIDLNVAAVEDNSANGMPMEHEGLSSPSLLQEPNSKVDSKQSKSPWIDLNRLYDAPDECTRPSLPLKSESPPLVDLNLDCNVSMGGKSNNLHRKGQDCQSLGNNTSDPANPRFNFTCYDYLTDFSTLQHVANNAHAPLAAPDIPQPVELMQKVASLQPKLPFALNLHSYPSRGPFHFGSGGPLSSSIHFSGTMPYARYPHEYGSLPVALNPGTVHPSFGTPRLVQIVHEQSSSSITSIPKLDNRTEDNLPANGIKLDDARLFSFVAKTPPVDECAHQGSWCATSTKRKEPEEGFQLCHLGYK